MVDELDILREIGNIAAGHGSTALSEILKRKVTITFPSVDIITSLEVPSKLQVEKTAVIIFAKVLVGLDGEVAVLLDQDNVGKLINLSYKWTAENHPPAFISEMSMSILKEIGNVIIASYLNAMSIMLKRIIVPPIPTLISSSIEDLLNLLLNSYQGTDYCYLIESTFKEDVEGIAGNFFLIMTPQTAQNIKTMCKKILSNPVDERDL